MQKTIISLLTLVIFALFFSLPVFALSDDNQEISGSPVWGFMKIGGLDEIGDKVYGAEYREQRDPVFLVAKVVMSFLSLLGVIFLVIVVYAGFRWMTAGGNEEQVAEAKKLLRNGVIGLAIIIGAYIITNFIFYALAIGTLPTV